MSLWVLWPLTSSLGLQVLLPKIKINTTTLNSMPSPDFWRIIINILSHIWILIKDELTF